MRVLQRCGYWHAAVVATAYLACLLGPHALIKVAPLPLECRHLGGVDDEWQDAFGREARFGNVRVSHCKGCKQAKLASNAAPVDLTMREGRIFTPYKT